jgi:hypothetical protein
MLIIRISFILLGYKEGRIKVNQSIMKQHCIKTRCKLWVPGSIIIIALIVMDNRIWGVMSICKWKEGKLIEDNKILCDCQHYSKIINK